MSELYRHVHAQNCHICGSPPGVTCPHDEYGIVQPSETRDLTDDHREALSYVATMIERNPIKACQDSVSKHHTKMVELALEAIAKVAAP